MSDTVTTPSGLTVSATIARAASVSAALRKAGQTRSVTKKSPGVKFPVPTLGFHVQQWPDHVRVSSTWRSGGILEKYTAALTKAGYVVEVDWDNTSALRVYKAVA